MGCPKEIRAVKNVQVAQSATIVALRVYNAEIRTQNDDAIDLPRDSHLPELRSLCYMCYIMAVVFSIIILGKTAWFIAYSWKNAKRRSSLISTS